MTDTELYDIRVECSRTTKGLQRLSQALIKDFLKSGVSAAIYNEDSQIKEMVTYTVRLNDDRNLDTIEKANLGHNSQHYGGNMDFFDGTNIVNTTAQNMVALLETTAPTAAKDTFHNFRKALHELAATLYFNGRPVALKPPRPIHSVSSRKWKPSITAVVQAINFKDGTIHLKRGSNSVQSCKIPGHIWDEISHICETEVLNISLNEVEGGEFELTEEGFSHVMEILMQMLEAGRQRVYGQGKLGLKE